MRPPIEPVQRPKPRLTKPRRDLMTRVPLRRAARDPGGVAERLKAADCKSADVRLRRFESYPLHQRFGSAVGIKGGQGKITTGGREGRVVHGAGQGKRSAAVAKAGVAQW